MPDFTFYREVYLGTAIEENAFPRLAARAQEYLQRLKRAYRVEGGEQAQAMAVCAMAECLLNRRKPGVRAATVGGVSVQYAEDSPELALYRAAGVYLDIYRGCANA